jgi:hypothetical protein
MSATTCSQCGTDLIPGTGFCRKCGAPAETGAEQPTAILNQPGDGTTKRLDPRSTNPYRDTEVQDGLSQELAAAAEKPPGANKRTLVFLGIVLVGFLACVSVLGLRSAFFGRSSMKSSGPVSRELIYPGSKVVLDITSESGGSVLQMLTPDPLDQVRAWYVAQLKPDKILQATINSSIMRKDNVTATLITENHSTTIVIKQR